MNGMLEVATVKLSHGQRASKLIGTAVENDQGEKIGSIDDLVLTQDDKLMVAIVSVGGFLGIGSKLVAVPWDRFHYGSDNNLQLSGASKQALNALPSFTFGS